jgi:predicted aspartyl protease
VIPRRAALVAILALAACAESPPQPACTLSHPAAAFVLPHSPIDIIPVTLGRTTVPFMLDTGAAFSILSTEASRAMGFRHTTQWFSLGEGAGGPVVGYPAKVGVMRIGNGTLLGARLSVQPLFNVPLKQLPVYGLIGSDIVPNWALDLDAAHSRLSLYDENPCTVLAPPWPDPAASVELTDNFSTYIEVEVSLDGRSFEAIVDTGATRSLLGASVARRLHLDLSHDRAITGRGVGGLPFAAHEHRIDNVVLGGVQIGPMTLRALTRDLPAGDLLLGQDFLHAHRIFVSYRQHRLWFAPASNSNQDAVGERR